LGLEAVQGEVGNMIEFSFDISNLLLKEEEVKAEVREVMRGQSMLRETGWTVTVKDGAVDQTGETRCVTYPPPTGHIKVISSQAKGVWDAVKILRDEGVLVM
jgi:hypothetical protein